ncbi:hypothetical protein N7507_008025 [Penicillium longicatenatum]|nr:hypothetical protein N7507_008025 [Penicillium longicatenatum]
MPPPNAPTRIVEETEPSPLSVEAASDSSESVRSSKRLRISESERVTPEEPGTFAKRPRRQNHTSTSNKPETPDTLYNIRKPDCPNETDTLRWELVKFIHSKPGPAPMEAHTLQRLLQVFQQDHMSYSEDEVQEKAELSVMLQERWDGPTKGGWLSNADMRALEFILKVPFMDRSAVDAHELEICRGVFESRGPKRPMSSAGLRLLSRVIRKSKPRDITAFDELNTAIETGVSMRILSEPTWLKCMEILSQIQGPAANQVGISTRGQLCRSGHKSQGQMPERSMQAKRLSASKPKPPAASPRPTLSEGLLAPKPTTRTESSTASSNPKQTLHLSESLAARLFKAYCHSEYPYMPILDLLALNPYQAPSKSKGGPIQIPPAGPLKFCYALACLGIDDVLKHAPELYQSARASMASIEDSGDLLSLVQCLVLQSQYLRAVGNLTSAREVIGLAIQKAYTLSIKAKSDEHFDPDSSSHKLAMRLWHSISHREMDSIFNKPHASDTWVDGIPGIAANDQNTGRCLSRFFYASRDLHIIMVELFDFEEQLRLSNGQCALKKIKEADIREFMRMEIELEDWHGSLPTVLRAISHLDSPSPLVGRLRNVLHLRYLYLRIRLYRPLMILGVALSRTCACGSKQGPHLGHQTQYGKNGITGLMIVQDASSKCLHLAEQLTDRLWEHKRSTPPPTDTPACEYVHYAYACGLAMIAARGLHFITDKEPSFDHAEKFDRILNLLEIGENNMVGNEDLSNVFRVCRKALHDLSRLAGEAHKSVLTSQDVDFNKPSWNKLYARIRIDPPTSPDPRLPDMSRLLGWFESLPVDLMP